jgi:hypothetical protein
MDKLIIDTGQEDPAAMENMSRYQLFLAGQLTVEDLDDEELLAMGFRTSHNTIFKPKNVPRDMVTQFTRAIFDRSLDKLKSSALDAANTLSSIMLDDSVDANVRVKAATEILDRTIGKAPLQVSINPGAAWEGVFEGLFSGTREDSRLNRAQPLDVDEVPDDDMPALLMRPKDDDSD